MAHELSNRALRFHQYLSHVILDKALGRVKLKIDQDVSGFESTYLISQDVLLVNTLKDEFIVKSNNGDYVVDEFSAKLLTCCYRPIQYCRAASSRSGLSEDTREKINSRLNEFIQADLVKEISRQEAESFAHSVGSFYLM